MIVGTEVWDIEPGTSTRPSNTLYVGLRHDLVVSQETGLRNTLDK